MTQAGDKGFAFRAVAQLEDAQQQSGSPSMRKLCAQEGGPREPPLESHHLQGTRDPAQLGTVRMCANFPEPLVGHMPQLPQEQDT